MYKFGTRNGDITTCTKVPLRLPLPRFINDAAVLLHCLRGFNKPSPRRPPSRHCQVFIDVGGGDTILRRGTGGARWAGGSTRSTTGISKVATCILHRVPVLVDGVVGSVVTLRGVAHRVFGGVKGDFVTMPAHRLLNGAVFVGGNGAMNTGECGRIEEEKS
ncbi:hypothetical protein GE21DRAFT_3807 [Neurospora crassa]|uniref:Uncharacterized protein n=1 Tax=Neurospora crassa (strain ATCC 24698 / 74-OR23-1A / CBS 708.71 / DSM 1257 / FGSC 987) TaxID=367110 RepID=Q7S0Z4_NEUCR|nr:hypothetical protein NCU09150 [Neurospora crassa OR74A]EAA29006.1 hypothetical protein NCU09150 [Neurospora crassa OR74A]KHE84373.1 hypothetical protein GE21DRAFT_3807 [Neurospora crassa]|eukprot:XP_958242.1 hypothetical protein NCU09150 [Neurospora crassa OR74A]